MAEKIKKNGNNKKVSGKSAENIGRRKKLAVIAAVCAVLLAVLFITAEYIIPALAAVRRSGGELKLPTVGTGVFFDGDDITAEDLAEYDKCIKYIYYKKDGVEALIADGKFYEFGGNAAVFFSKYIDAIKNGDSRAYSECFSEKFDNGTWNDPFVSGKNDFPPQRLYDIHIESLEEIYDEAAGAIKGKFSVNYKIFLNEGNFRNDMDMYNETAPLLVQTEESGGVVKITSVSYFHNEAVGEINHYIQL